MLEFLARVLDHLPNPSQQLLRHWGWYSNAARRRRERHQGEASATPRASSAGPPASRPSCSPSLGRVVHCRRKAISYTATSLTAEQIELIARRGVKVGLCPGTDPMIGAGLPQIYPLLAGGVPLENLSFTVGVTAQTPADPFEMLRTLVNAGRIQQLGNTSLYAIVQANPEWRFSYRDALRLGTLSGANVLGIADRSAR